MRLTVAEIASRVGGQLDGDGSGIICGLAGIKEAVAEDITFLANPRYAADLAKTNAGAVLVGMKTEKIGTAALIRVPDPDRSFAQIAALFAPPAPKPAPGVHPTAIVATDAIIGSGVSIGPLCVVESGAQLGPNSVVGAQCYIGQGVVIGADTRLYPQVSIREYVRIGNRVIIHNGTVIGSDGFGYTVDQEGVRTKIPQIGTVWIDDDVEVGANVTIDRARFGKTRIGKGVKIDNLVQIAHNVVIGDHAVIVAQVGISGSSTIGSKAVLAGQVGIAGHLSVGEGAIVGAQSGVSKNVPPGAFFFGYPAMPYEKITRVHGNMLRLPLLKEKVDLLEKEVAALKAKLGADKA